MIDPLDNQLIPLREAYKHLPPGRNGKPLHPSTVYRWAQGGVRGVRLDTLKIGGARYTSEAALRAFIERTNSDTPLSEDPPEAVKEFRSIPRGPAARKRAKQQMEELFRYPSTLKRGGGK